MKNHKTTLIGNMMKNKRLVFLIISLLAAIIVGVTLNIPEPSEPYRDMTPVLIMEGYSEPRYRAESKDPEVQEFIQEMIAMRKKSNKMVSRIRRRPAIHYPDEVIQQFKHDVDVYKKKFIGLKFDSITEQGGEGSRVFKNLRVSDWHPNYVKIHYDLRKAEAGHDVYKSAKIRFVLVDDETKRTLGFNKELKERYSLYSEQIGDQLILY
jgi:hypothetical protein